MQIRHLAACAALLLATAPAGFAQSKMAPSKSTMTHSGMMMQTPASKKVMQQVKGIKSGKNYKCCIKPKCDWCAVHMGSCPCGKMAATGKPVCVNCKGGWDAGQGVVPGKTAADIKVMTMGDMNGMEKMNGMKKGKM